MPNFEGKQFPRPSLVMAQFIPLLQHQAKTLFNRPCSLPYPPRCAFFHYLFTLTEVEFFYKKVLPNGRGKIDLIRKNLFMLVVISKIELHEIYCTGKKCILMKKTSRSKSVNMLLTQLDFTYNFKKRFHCSKKRTNQA